jgi:ABC-type uncharacterized transport system ATPase subunit
VDLDPGTSPQAFLQCLVGQVSVRRFEVVSPSLHNIFVGLVSRGGKTVTEPLGV